jgi:hypothetical protein
VNLLVYMELPVYPTLIGPCSLLAWTELIDHNSELTVGDVLDSELNKNISKNSEKMGKKIQQGGGYMFGHIC